MIEVEPLEPLVVPLFGLTRLAPLELLAAPLLLLLLLHAGEPAIHDQSGCSPSAGATALPRKPITVATQF
jgi:hypothetical protein